MPLHPIYDYDLYPWLARHEVPTEAELIQRRIASNEKWKRRRRKLRVKALVFGRRRAVRPARPTGFRRT